MGKGKSFLGEDVWFLALAISSGLATVLTHVIVQTNNPMKKQTPMKWLHTLIDSLCIMKKDLKVLIVELKLILYPVRMYSLSIR